MNAHVWLTEVARHAKLPGAERLPADLGGSVDEAWAMVCRVCDLDPFALAQVVGKHYGLPASGQAAPKFDPAALPEAFAKRYGLLPIRTPQGELLLGTSQPPDKALVDRVALVTEHAPRFIIAPPGALALGMLAAYEQAAERSQVIRLDTLSPTEVSVGQLAAAASAGSADAAASPVVRLANMMLAEAIRLRASDVHLQPTLGVGNLRFRIDGVLRRVAYLPRSVTRRMIGRIKALSGMDPTDSLHPQDGAARVAVGGVTYDMRVSTLPVHGGEKVVIRFLPENRITGLDAVGLGEPELGQLKALLERGSGLLLVTGPTGCGKTTTLHSALAERNRVNVSIVTVEDPVEYRVPLLAQVEVNPAAGLTFASALRAVLRQDPDVVLVGEIRDAETAQLAAQASLTGHQVLSTLHTLDAASAIPRLLDLGVSRAILGEALAGVMAQRLVRRLCKECKQPAAAPYTDQEAWVMQHARVAHPMRAVGCPACSFTGYRGRVLVAQVYEVTPAEGEKIAAGAGLDVIRANARATGMRTLADSVLDRVRAGETTVQEAAEELGKEFWMDLGARSLMVAHKSDAQEQHDKVLLVERDAGARRALRRELEQAGFRVEEAEHAGVAHERLERAGDFAAMVMDLDGLLAERVNRLMQLRNSLVGAAIPVIALSDERAASLEDAVRAHGTATLILKPVAGEQIIQALRQRLSEAETG